MEIVSFEISKKLKEKGYPQEAEKHNAWYATEYYKNSCLGEYFEGELTPIGECGDKINALHIIEVENKGVVAPTISQVLKWLREENIHLYTDIDNEGWFFEIKCLKTRFMVNTDFFKRHSTCEQASVAGISYCLDNLL